MLYPIRLAREYHSPSSDALGRKCMRAWGYAYIEGLRLPAEVLWETIEKAGAGWANVATPKQRSLSLGKAVHAVAEAYFEGRPADFTSLPGQIFMSGAHLLPHPSRLAAPPRVERPIGPDVVPQGCEGVWYGGIRWLGYVDLRVLPTEAESARLGLASGWVTIDYKTTKDLRWAKSAEALREDGQANLYGYDAVLSGHGEGQCRWIYFQTQGKRQAVPVDFRIALPAATKILDDMTERALYLDTLPSIEACPPNPRACGDFGGCEYHYQNGGPCSARAKLGALIQARIPRKEETMGFLDDYRKKQAEAKAAAPAAPAAPAEPAPTAAEPTPAPAGANGPAEANPAPAKRGPGRPRTSPAPATPATVADSPNAPLKGAQQAGPVTCELRVTGSPAALVDLLQRFPA